MNREPSAMMPNETQATIDLDAVEGPRTYEAAFRFNDQGGPLLVTAEEWLREEADVSAAMAVDDDPSDEPNRGATLLAIAREVETLRRERAQWAASHTALAAENTRLREDAARWAFVRERLEINEHEGVSHRRAFFLDVQIGVGRMAHTTERAHGAALDVAIDREIAAREVTP